ncbi:MAG: hypothetical protein ACYDBJ_29405 [Aggregatilineales bacterium]
MDTFEWSRSTCYYQSTQRGETAVVETIEQVLMRCPCFGYRRVIVQLQQEGIPVGK